MINLTLKKGKYFIIMQRNEEGIFKKQLNELFTNIICLSQSYNKYTFKICIRDTNINEENLIKMIDRINGKMDCFEYKYLEDISIVKCKDENLLDEFVFGINDMLNLNIEDLTIDISSMKHTTISKHKDIIIEILENEEIHFLSKKSKLHLQIMLYIEYLNKHLIKCNCGGYDFTTNVKACSFCDILKCSECFDDEIPENICKDCIERGDKNV